MHSEVDWALHHSLQVSPPEGLLDWPTSAPLAAELMTPSPCFPLPSYCTSQQLLQPLPGKTALCCLRKPTKTSPHLRQMQRLAGPLEQKEHHRHQLRQEGHQLVAEVLHEICHAVQQPHPLPRRQLLQALSVDVLQPPAAWAAPQLSSPPGLRKQPASTATSCQLPGSSLSPDPVFASSSQQLSPQLLDWPDFDCQPSTREVPC